MDQQEKHVLIIFQNWVIHVQSILIQLIILDLDVRSVEKEKLSENRTEKIKKYYSENGMNDLVVLIQKNIVQKKQ